MFCCKFYFDLYRSIVDKSSGGSKAIYCITAVWNYKFFMKFLSRWSSDPTHFSRVYSANARTLAIFNRWLFVSLVLTIAEVTIAGLAYANSNHVQGWIINPIDFVAYQCVLFVAGILSWRRNCGELQERTNEDSANAEKM